MLIMIYFINELSVIEYHLIYIKLILSSDLHECSLSTRQRCVGISSDFNATY